MLLRIGFELRGLLRFRQKIRMQAARRRPGLLEIRLVAFVRDDGRSGVCESAQSARVIKMHMAGDDEFDRLVRNRSLSFSIRASERSSLSGASTRTI